ncbi:cytidine and deoxycytidylate deaminase zinc-binding region [Necator americanus]|uniref:Probable deoxycytidylate deaminase n=1 Tax=Necator americanus TaxID=51031 RepID=W2TJS5_NECAM|nr:cytidine and deoxycytidylate deaminase zinc-binding region [Necator americanus]ETN81874.1 cytidine and deoxycytidylate deaminase zinc-binding region [Necator americanus]
MEGNAIDEPKDSNGFKGDILKNGETTVKGTGKRMDYLSWEDYFMAIAKLASMRSKDPATQVGCAIVNRDNKVVGTGYNGFPVGISDDDLPWTKGSPDPLENKHTYVVHAEVNAILNKSMNNVEGCTMYTTLLPCNECAKLIIQSRLSEVVFLHDCPTGSWTYDATRKMFELAGIKCRQFKTSLDSVVITFT